MQWPCEEGNVHLSTVCDYWIARVRACEGNQVGAFCGNVWRGKRRAAAACTVALLCLAPLLYAHQSVVACLAVRRAEF
jgi:hypothetical protein